MLKAKVANLDIVEFDDRSPISVISFGSSNQAFYATLGFVLNPILALRTGATWVKVQILRQQHKNPTVLDDVEDRSDIKDNIKAMSGETTQKYNDFLERDVLAEKVFSVADIMNAVAPGLAYEYNEGGNLEAIAAKMPVTPVMTVKRKTKKRQLTTSAEMEPNTTFTFPEMEGLLDAVPSRLSINSTTVGRFSLLGPMRGKVVSNVMHYPFPVSTVLTPFSDVRACPRGAVDQQSGMLFLKDSDFQYVDNNRILSRGDARTPVATMDGEKEGRVEEVEEVIYGRDVEARVASPFSTLSTVYREFAAYNGTKTGENFVTFRRMNVLPFVKGFPFVTNLKVSSFVTLKVVVTNQNGVVLSVLKKDVDIFPLLVDTSRPIHAPDVAVATTSIGDTAQAIVIDITQRDQSASQIVLMIKESPTSKFRQVGMFPLRYLNDHRVILPVNVLRGPVILRAIAVLDPGRSSSAFTDTPIFIDTLEDLTTPDGGQEQPANPGQTIGLNIATQVYPSDTDLYNVTIPTAVVKDGRATRKDPTSYYDNLFLRRLVPSNGDEAYGAVGVKGGEYVIDIATGVDASISPGSTFVDEQVTEGTYLYVIDGYAKGEEIPNIASAEITVRSQNVPDLDGKKTNVKGIEYQTVDQQVVVRGGNAEFEVTTKIKVPVGITVKTYVLDAALDLTTRDLTKHSIQVGDYSPMVIKNDDGTSTIKFSVPLTSSDISFEMKDAIKDGNVRSMGLNLPVQITEEDPTQDELTPEKDGGKEDPVEHNTSRTLSPAVMRMIMLIMMGLVDPDDFRDADDDDAPLDGTMVAK